MEAKPCDLGAARLAEASSLSAAHAAPAVPESDLVDTVIYETRPGSPSLDLPGTYEGQDTLLDDSLQTGSISASNACAQRHFETKITAKEASNDFCCQNTSVFCAFNVINENADDGYCQSRHLCKGRTTLSAALLRSADCSHTPESLAIIQPLLEQNILMESCPIASTERTQATLISKEDVNVKYSSVERSSAETAPNCSVATTEDCEIYLVSNLINNSTSKLDVSANCDGQNLIGFTVATRDPCLGTSEFPCTSGKPWKLVTRPASLVTGEIAICPNGSNCRPLSEGNQATLDAPNDSNNYVFAVKSLPAGSSFIIESEFAVELFYNDDLKIAIDAPVLTQDAVVYSAFELVPSQGVYAVLNDFFSP